MCIHVCFYFLLEESLLIIISFSYTGTHYLLNIMKFTVLSTLLASAAAFAPSKVAKTSTALNLNGWSADDSAFCYGLPGSLAPVGEFDPLGLAKDADLATIKKYREAELQHGRVGK
jgi:hypothetical protein